VQQSWNEFPIRGAVVARKDLEGSLDRPSHLFAKGDPVPKSKILHMARRFGEQDAEKYIERIVHGAWSAGNISNSGHMIDFDSIAALKGRAAHFTLTGKYVGNQFGGEGLGQLKLLDSIIDHPINVDKATAQEVHEAFWKARQEMLVSRFPDLIGIPPAKAGNLLYYRKGEVENLVTDFENLGRYMYPNYRSMAADNERADSLSVFDLSKFMRLYPLLKAQGKDTPENLLSLLMNKGGSLEPVENKYVSQEVKAQLHALGAVVDSPEKLSQVEAEAKLFIEKYRKFLGSLEREDGDNISSQELAMQAYRANEDRYYLNYQEETNFVEDLSKAYQDKRITPQRMGRVLKLLEESNNRLPIPDGAQGALSDIRIFREGWTARRLNTDGTFREVMGVFQDELPSFNKGTKLSLDSSSLQPAKSEHSGELLFESNPRPFVELTTAAQSKVKVNGGDLKWHLFGGD
ncbi:MAG: hypothetical protein ACXVBE_12470, partial [Bdellovibrionota bacterium]